MPIIHSIGANTYFDYSTASPKIRMLLLLFIYAFALPQASPAKPVSFNSGTDSTLESKAISPSQLVASTPETTLRGSPQIASVGMTFNGWNGLYKDKKEVKDNSRIIGPERILDRKKDGLTSQVEIIAPVSRTLETIGTSFNSWNGIKPSQPKPSLIEAPKSTNLGKPSNLLAGQTPPTINSLSGQTPQINTLSGQTAPTINSLSGQTAPTINSLSGQTPPAINSLLGQNRNSLSGQTPPAINSLSGQTPPINTISGQTAPTINSLLGQNRNSLSGQTPPAINSLSGQTPPINTLSGQTAPTINSLSGQTPPAINSLLGQNRNSLSGQTPATINSLSSQTPPTINSITGKTLPANSLLGQTSPTINALSGQISAAKDAEIQIPVTTTQLIQQKSLSAGPDLVQGIPPTKQTPILDDKENGGLEKIKIKSKM
jgi:hypothetical protein